MSPLSPPVTPNRANPMFLALFFSGAAILVGMILLLSHGLWSVIVDRLMVDGTAALFWLAAAWGIGTTILRVTRISFRSHALQVAVAAALGLGAIGLITLLLGLSGMLGKSSGMVLIVIGAAMAAVNYPKGISLSKFTSQKPRSANWFWLALVPSTAVVLVGACVLPGLLWGDEPHGYDVLEYHLQVPREWFEAGKITALTHNVFSYLPFNVEMHYLLAMHLRGTPWQGMYLAQIMHAIFVALTVVAVYGIVMEQTSDPSAAMVSALIAGTAAWMSMLATVAYDEGGLLLFGTLSIGCAIGAQNLKQMLLAGALAGLACGAKLTAVPLVLLTVPAVLLAARRVRWTWVAGFVCCGLITFSPWLIRTWAWSGNPVFPEAMSVLGHGRFSEVQVERWDRAHSPREDQNSVEGRLRALWDQVGADWRFGFVVLPLALIAPLLGRHRKESGILWLVLVIQIVIWTTATHLQGRFLVLAVPISAILIGWIDQRMIRSLAAATIVLVALVGTATLAVRVDKVSPAIGLADYRPLLGEWLDANEPITPLFELSSPIVLIGDAQPFRFSIPMTQLKYRTVFDVDTVSSDTAQDLARGWLNAPWPTDARGIVFPAELSRLNQTYWKVLDSPGDWMKQAKPFVVTP